MSTLLAHVPVDRIGAQAREVRFWRTVLTVIAGVLFGAGWVAFKVCALTWLALAWCAVAVREGWREARSSEMRRHPPGGA